MKAFLTLFWGIIAVALTTFAVSASTGWDPGLVAIGATGLSFVTPFESGLAYAGLNKEIWLDVLMEGFYGDDSWLMDLRDFDAFVDNDKINLAEAGINPDVLINNTTYPIPIADRTDTAISIELDRFDTENTSIKFANLVELAYDKLKSVLFGHRQALRMSFMQKAAHAIAPAADSEFTPVLTTTGADDGSGYKKMTFDDLLEAQARLDQAEVPEEGRVILLSVKHRKHLKAEDRALYKEMMSDKEIYGFEIRKLADKRLPFYDTADDTKEAFGAVPAATAQVASVFFHKDEVCRAKGTVDMFYAEPEPRYRQHEIGFAMRGIVLPIRDKGIGSIYQAAV